MTAVMMRAQYDAHPIIGNAQDNLTVVGALVVLAVVLAALAVLIQKMGPK